MARRYLTLIQKRFPEEKYCGLAEQIANESKNKGKKAEVSNIERACLFPEDKCLEMWIMGIQKRHGRGVAARCVLMYEPETDLLRLLGKAREKIDRKYRGISEALSKTKLYAAAN